MTADHIDRELWEHNQAATVKPIVNALHDLIDANKAGPVPAAIVLPLAEAALEEWNARVPAQSAGDGEIEKELEALRKYAHEATIAITGLTSGGSEFFSKRVGDIYLADLPFCVQRIRETRESLFETMKAARREAKQLRGQAIDRPDWAKIYEKGFFGQDGDQELLTVTRESLRLAASVLRSVIGQDAYHNSMAASVEIEAVLKAGERNAD